MQITRQPIFSKDLRVLGYELAYGGERKGARIDEQASRLVLDTFMDIQLSRIAGRRRAYLPVSEALLDSDVASLFAPDRVALIVPTPPRDIDAFARTLRNLHERRFRVMLDDFALDDAYAPLRAHAYALRVDAQTRERDLARIASEHRGIRLMLRDVRTREAFDRAVAWGYEAFQGGFLTEPVHLPGKSMRPLPANYLQLLQLINDPKVDLQKVATIVSHDVGLSYDLLRMLNTTEFAFRKRVQSVLLAVVALGVNGTRRWISLVVLAGLNESQPTELLNQSLLRAHFLQRIGEAQRRKDGEALFLLGLFSLMDAITGNDFQTVLEDIPIPEEVKDALIERGGEYEPYRLLMLAQAQGDWETLSRVTKEVGLTPEAVTAAYIEAAEWSDTITETKHT